MRCFLACLAFVAVFSTNFANAEVTESSAGAFLLSYETTVAASPDEAYRALTQMPHWWNGAHSYSGDARRMSFDPRAGGCFCERWAGNSVEHARTVLNMEHEGVRTVRLVGALGPLQDMGVSGVMTFTIAPDTQGAKLTMTYRVAGDPGLALQNLASPVDGVLQEQFDRFTRYTAN